MNDYEQKTGCEGFNVQSFLNFLRAAGALVGLVAMIIGLGYAVRIFTLISDTLTSPDGFSLYLDQWIAAAGGDELNIVVNGIQYNVAVIVTVLIVGGGTALLAWMSLAFIVTGAKAISWTLGDRAAVKKLLTHAFGPARKPDADPADGDSGRKEF